MNLKAFRKKSGLSQAELSALSGVSKQHITFLETDKRDPERMALEHCRAIVAALNGAGVRCTVDDVFPPSEADTTDTRKTA
jgi:putative transcriptional regulator